MAGEGSTRSSHWEEDRRKCAQDVQADPIFDDATASDTAMHMLNPQPVVGECLSGHLLLQRQFLAERFLSRYEVSTGE